MLSSGRGSSGKGKNSAAISVCHNGLGETLNEFLKEFLPFHCGGKKINSDLVSADNNGCSLTAETFS